MKVTRMAAPLGAIVSDLDVTSVNADQWAELNELFCQHHVLVFPGQNLTPDAQVAFAGLWGPLIPFPYGGLPDYPNIIELKNHGKATDVNQHWHSDMTYNEQPPKLTMLYAHAAPPLGGETAFSNQIAAYEDLSVGLRGLVDSLSAVHSAEGLARLYGEDEKQAPRALHPVVRTHDESGARGLYVCKAFTTRFQDWTRQESKPVLEYLFEQSVRPEYQARHQWHAGDLVMWDNRCLLHYAVHDHGDDPRIIHRCQVEGPTPG
jgi:taurine dioxygenase